MSKMTPEEQRLKALYDYNILDTGSEKDYDDLTYLASYICNTPIALISLSDTERQWFKSRQGIKDIEVPREIAFCNHAIKGKDTFIVPDAKEDGRFASNPLVANDDPGLRYYAGVPLVNPEGHVLGTICVIDTKPRELTAEQLRALESLGRQTIQLLEARKTLREKENLINLYKNERLRLKENILRLNQSEDDRKRIVAELITARQAAEKSTRAKEQFLAHMSHEIRTPMNAVIGLTNLMLSKKPKGDELKYLSAIQSSAENLLVIINDILDFSKIEAGKVEIEEMDFLPDRVFEQVIQINKVKADEKGLRLLLTRDSSMPQVLKGDPVRLQQILLNLVSNAVKFTDAGEVSVRALINEISDNRIIIEFSVRDTGIGIPEESLPDIFESFTQAKNSGYRGSGGTGLGLTISKRLAELMGGCISVKSRPGTGSTFTFTLPFGVSSKKAEDICDTHVESSITGDLKNMKVLLVEDNEMNQLVAKSLLEIWKTEYDVADNGAEAIEKLRHKSFDLILMDLSMPGMDGYETTEYIRRNFKSPLKDIPVIALTASALNDVRQKVMQAGMNDYVSKPFRPSELFGKMEKYLRHSEAGAAEQNTPERKNTEEKDAAVKTTAVRKKNPEEKGASAKHSSKGASKAGTSEHRITPDFSYLTEATAGNSALMRDMLSRFLDNTPSSLKQLEAFASEKNWTELGRVAHRIKPTFHYAGIPAAQPYLEALEKIADVVNPNELSKSSLRQLLNIWRDVLEVINYKIEELKQE